VHSAAKYSQAHCSADTAAFQIMHVYEPETTVENKNLFLHDTPCEIKCRQLTAMHFPTLCNSVELTWNMKSAFVT